MNILFLGTSSFSSQILEYLLENSVSIIGVVTQPDTTHNNRTQKPPVKILVQEKYPHIPLYQPEKASSENFIHQMQQLKIDLMITVAYGQILSEQFLKLAKIDAINVHASLLPFYRGASPIQRVLLNNEKETGITIMKMIKELDAGDIIESVKVNILQEDNFTTLEEKLCQTAKPLLLKVIHQFEKKEVKYFPQDSNKATYTKKIDKEELFLDWKKSAQANLNSIRAFSINPGARVYIQLNHEKKILKILKAQVIDQNGKPGEILEFSQQNWIVACQNKALKLLEVQLEGKKRVSFQDFVRGYQQASLAFLP
jgi:methionyl-tRNA formyltransferase